MNFSRIMGRREQILDLIRGLSAILVAVGHARGFVLCDYADIRNPGLLLKLFYFATGLGSQAVVVFFVLSGYFVGGSVLSGVAAGRFRWAPYAVARLSRLWVVLAPALFLTLALDSLGAQWSPQAYAGAFHAQFMSGPSLHVPADTSVAAFVGNLIFLQTIISPVYGSNGPLWSLANEFWYYVMFPLIAVAMARSSGMRGRVFAVVQAILFALIVSWLPTGILMGGVIWLMGAGVWWLVWKTGNRSQGAGDRGQEDALASSIASSSNQQSTILNRQSTSGAIGWFRCWPWRLVGGLLFLGTLAASKTHYWFGSDGAVGCVFAFWMLSLPGGWRVPVWLNRLVTGLSEISYTLYVVHFPLLFFVAAVVLKGRQFPADAQGFLWFGGLTVGILVISAGMWWLFERNTDRVRKWLLSAKA